MWCKRLIDFLVVVTGAVLKRGCRGIWDAFMFHAVIKKKAKVPASNSFVARRIAGPGLASNYFYQVTNYNTLYLVTISSLFYDLFVFYIDRFS